VVTLSEGASHAVADAEIGAIGGQGQRRAGLGPRLYACLEEDWLLIADRGFYSFDGWNTAAAAGGALLWRVKADLLLPVLELLPDGSYSSVLFRAGLHDKARAILTAAARAGENLDGDKAVAVRSFPPVLAVHLLSGFAPTAGSEPLACWPSAQHPTFTGGGAP
jgi:hypothetical protein